MPYNIGTGIKTIGTCDAEIIGEKSRFSYGEREYALYRHGSCTQLSAGNFKLYRDGSLVDTYAFPSYWGYVYYWCQDYRAGSYEIVCTIGSDVMRRYFTIEQEPLALPEMPNVKKSIGEYYQLAKTKGWSSCMIRTNQMRAYRREKGHCGYYDPDKEDCPSYAVHQFIDGPVLMSRRDCSSMSSEHRDALTGLGFTLKEQCFWCLEYPGSGGLGFTYCLIRNSTRDLTEEEMWLPELKQRAIDMGYDIRAVPNEGIEDGCLDWGFFDPDGSIAYNKFNTFCQDTGVLPAGANRYPVTGGYVWCFRSIYANTMASITEPYFPEPVGLITECNINGKDCPDCGIITTPSGRVEVLATMRNSGGVGKFRFYVKDQSGNVLLKTPETLYQSVSGNTNWYIYTYFSMPSKALNGELVLVKET